MPTNPDNLKHAVEAMHACGAVRLTSGIVHEMMDGQTVWKGTVDTFELFGHPKASKAYAWAWKDDSGETRYMAVLNLPPVNSPREAVQATLASAKPH